jgi:hypothetical protein
MFINDHACIGCPVWKFTGVQGCHGTPFRELDRLLIEYKYDNSKETKEQLLKAIDDEILFLREVYAEWLRNKINEELKGKV